MKNFCIGHKDYSKDYEVTYADHSDWKTNRFLFQIYFKEYNKRTQWFGEYNIYFKDTRKLSKSIAEWYLSNPDRIKRIKDEC